MKHAIIDTDRESSLESSDRLASKITGLLILFFFIAVAAISTTLYVSWQLEAALRQSTMPEARECAPI